MSKLTTEQRKKIKIEFIYSSILIIIIFLNIIWCTVENENLVWNYKYENWVYNTNPQEGTGWIDAVIKINKE